MQCGDCTYWHKRGFLWDGACEHPEAPVEEMDDGELYCAVTWADGECQDPKKYKPEKRRLR